MRSPEGGTAIMLGGDILGLDVAQAMAASGHRVILVPSEQTFSPHRVDEADRPPLLEALGRAGIEVVDGGADRAHRGRAATAARRARWCSPTAARSRATS